MLIIFLSWLILISTITACNNTENTDKPASDKLSIITTIFPQYDFTKQIAGEKVDLKMLLKPGAESHSYEPTLRTLNLFKPVIFLFIPAVKMILGLKVSLTRWDLMLLKQ